MNLRKKRCKEVKTKEKTHTDTHTHTHTHTHDCFVFFTICTITLPKFLTCHMLLFSWCAQKKFKREEGKLQFCLFPWGASAQSVFRSLIFCQLARKKKRQSKGRKSPDFQPNALPCEDGVCRRDMLPPVWRKKLQGSTRPSGLVDV